jgi:hypothetical protein
VSLSLTNAQRANGRALATYHSSTANNDYTITMDNGVFYINSPQFASPCLYSRIEVRDNAPYSTEYARKIVATILMAKASGKNLTFVWDDATAPTCLLSSIIMAN